MELSLFNPSHSDGCAVDSHGACILCFSNDWWCLASIHLFMQATVNAFTEPWEGLLTDLPVSGLDLSNLICPAHLQPVVFLTCKLDHVTFLLKTHLWHSLAFWIKGQSFTCLHLPRTPAHLLQLHLDHSPPHTPATLASSGHVSYSQFLGITNKLLSFSFSAFNAFYNYIPMWLCDWWLSLPQDCKLHRRKPGTCLAHYCISGALM